MSFFLKNLGNCSLIQERTLKARIYFLCNWYQNYCHSFQLVIYTSTLSYVCIRKWGTLLLAHDAQNRERPFDVGTRYWEG